MSSSYVILTITLLLVFSVCLLCYLFIFSKVDQFDYSKSVICEFKTTKDEVVVNTQKKIKFFNSLSFFKSLGINIDEINSFYQMNKDRARSTPRNYLIYSKKKREIISDLFDTCPSEYAILISFTAANSDSVWFKISPSVFYKKHKAIKYNANKSHYSFDGFCQKIVQIFSPGKATAITVRCNYELIEFNKYFPDFIRNLELDNLNKVAKSLPIKKRNYHISNNENGCFLQIFLLNDKMAKKSNKIVNKIDSFSKTMKNIVNDWELNASFRVGIKERIFDKQIDKIDVKKMIWISSFNCNYAISKYPEFQETKEYKSIFDGIIDPVLSFDIESQSDYSITFSPILDSKMQVSSWMPIIELKNYKKTMPLAKFIEVCVLYKNSINEVKTVISKFVDASIGFYKTQPIIFPIPFGFEDTWTSINKGYVNSQKFITSNYILSLIKFQNTRIDSMEYSFNFYNRFNIKYGITTSEINYLEHIIKSYGIQHIIYDNYNRINSSFDLGDMVKLENLITHSKNLDVIYSSLGKAEFVDYLKKFGINLFQGKTLTEKYFQSIN